MDWKKIISDLQDRGGYTLEQISEMAGFASKGHVHDLKTGKQATCSYEVGCRLVAIHKRVMRKAARSDA